MQPTGFQPTGFQPASTAGNTQPVLLWVNYDSSGNLTTGGNSIPVGSLLIGWSNGAYLAAPRGSLTVSPATLTELVTVDTSDGQIHGTVWYKIADSTDAATSTWTVGNKDGSAANYRGVLLCYQAGTFDPTTPVNYTIETASTFLTDVTTPALTVPRDGSRVLVIAINNGFANGVSPGSIVEAYNAQTGSAQDPAIWAQAYDNQPAGSFGAKTLTYATNNGNGKRGLALAIQSKAAASGTAYTLTAAQGTFSLTGVAAALRPDRRVPAPAAGAFALTGVAAALRIARKVTAPAAGAFTLTGVAAALTRSGSTYTLTSASGAFRLNGGGGGSPLGLLLTLTGGSGATATIRYGRTFPAATGTFSLTGVAAGLKVGRQFAAAKGTYTLTGVAATVTAVRKLPVTAGSFTLFGAGATLIYSGAGNKTLTAASGSFALTGLNIGLRYGGRLTAATGAYSLTGQPIALTYRPVNGRTLTALGGTFSLTGADADLPYYRADAIVAPPLSGLVINAGALDDTSGIVAPPLSSLS